MNGARKHKFGIRLVIPICEDDEISNEYYCEQSKPNNHEIRKLILQKAMEYEAKRIDLIVTSNNFLSFFPPKKIEGKEQIGKLVTDVLKELRHKKPLILGFDLLTKAIVFNPYGGINATVCFLDVMGRNKYECKRQIWECWEDKSKCNKSCIVDQNCERIFCNKDKKICLLSCGDILGYCHAYGKNLPDADIYLGLAHMNFSKWNVRAKEKDNEMANIQVWKKKKAVVIVTQQLSRDVIRRGDRNFIENGERMQYRLIWPPALRHDQIPTMFNAEHAIIDRIEDASYLFVDIIEQNG